MSEKLSERLINAADDGDNLGVNEHTVDTALLSEAARIVRAVEEADEHVFGERSRNGCAVLVALPSWYGKRVKLVEVE